MNPFCLCCPGPFPKTRISRISGPCPGMMGGICQIEAKEAMASIAIKSPLNMMIAPLKMRGNMQNILNFYLLPFKGLPRD